MFHDRGHRLRASIDQVKAAILYPDVEVRESAICYFRNKPCVDQTIMPLVIEAYAQFGKDAFSIPNVWPDLPQTAATLDWIIEQIRQMELPTTDLETQFASALAEALCGAEASLLPGRMATIRALPGVSAQTIEILDNRLHLSKLSCEELWTELLMFCEAHEHDEELTDLNLANGNTIVELLGPFAAVLRSRVLAILSDGPPDNGDLLDAWIVELAGRFRLEKAIPRLIERLEEPDLVSGEMAHRALELIGTDAVVAEIRRCYQPDDWDLSSAFASTLEDIHTDLSVRTSLALYEEETEDEIKGLFLQAALMNFASEAIAPARQVIIASSKSPDLLEVRTALLTCCKLLGERFPEFDEWQEDSRHDVEFRREWCKDHPLRWAPPEEKNDQAEDWLDDEADDEATTVRRQTEKVGRNDPCPCGSGRK